MVEEAVLPEADALIQKGRLLGKRAHALAAMAKAVQKRSPAAIEKALDKLRAFPVPDTAAEEAGIADWLAWERRERGPRFFREIQEACRLEELDLLVLTETPLELRIPPVSVRVDLEGNEARILFSEQLLASCEANAPAVLRARAGAVKALEGRSWKPEDFHRSLLRAWRAVGGPRRDWVELVDILPALSFERQSRRFRRDPTASNFRPYPRARFAYDLYRLRRDAALTVEGMRLSLGPATGGSTRDKSRVFRLEDPRGQGQYYLTLRFGPVSQEDAT